jgi:hypothetical protein
MGERFSPEAGKIPDAAYNQRHNPLREQYADGLMSVQWQHDGPPKKEGDNTPRLTTDEAASILARHGYLDEDGAPARYIAELLDAQIHLDRSKSPDDVAKDVAAAITARLPDRMTLTPITQGKDFDAQKQAVLAEFKKMGLDPPYVRRYI